MPTEAQEHNSANLKAIQRKRWGQKRRYTLHCQLVFVGGKRGCLSAFNPDDDNDTREIEQKGKGKREKGEERTAPATHKGRGS